MSRPPLACDGEHVCGCNQRIASPTSEARLDNEQPSHEAKRHSKRAALLMQLNEDSNAQPSLGLETTCPPKRCHASLKAMRSAIDLLAVQPARGRSLRRLAVDHT